MKKNQGFTLVELLAVIAILSIISLIAIPTVGRTTNTSKEKLYNIQMNNLKFGAKNWGADHPFHLPSVGNTKTLTLLELKQGGYVDSDITNPKTKEKFDDDCTKVIITNNNGKLEYSVDLSTCPTS